MRRSRERPDLSWPSWRYGPEGESAVFRCEEDVPIGWTKKPGDTPVEVYSPPPTVPLDRDYLVTHLLENGVEINPTWSNAHMKRIIDGDISTTW